eukprot:jgi/Botrbrau1/8949/Bobra.0148s0062.1
MLCKYVIAKNELYREGHDHVPHERREREHHQATNIQEALEVGARTLLVDEDTCATNFMIRDARMQALVAKEKEPITPFISQDPALAAGGSSCVPGHRGARRLLFDICRYGRLHATASSRTIVTSEAHSIARQFGAAAAVNGSDAPLRKHHPAHSHCHIPRSDNASPCVPQGVRKGERGIKVKTRTTNAIDFGSTELNLEAVEQLVEKSQTRAVACALQILRNWLLTGKSGGRTLSQLLDQLEQENGRKGVGCCGPGLQQRVPGQASPL